MVQIHTEAIKRLRNMDNPSFLIIELVNDLIIDFAETGEEALQKCINADAHGSECKFFETSMSTIEILKNSTKNIDVEDEQKGIVIEGLDSGFFPS